MKKLICEILMLIFLVSLFGCGSKYDESDDYLENTTASTKVSVSAEPETPKVEPRDKWLVEHNVTIIPQGTYTTKTMGSDSEIDIINSISITETTDGCPEGYKKVIAAFKTDPEAPSHHYWYSTFDRYTGYSFEFSTEPTSGVDTGSARTLLDYEINVDIGVEFDFSDAEMRYVKITCPKDYDGTVFYGGYASDELGEELQKFDFSGNKIYTIDQLPYWGSEYRFFSYTND